MGRYIERAEGTTRLLVELHQLLLQETGDEQQKGVMILMRGLGLEVEDVTTLPSLVRAVYGSAEMPNSILGSLDAARNNARSVRDALPPDFFEVLNKAHMRVQIQPDPHFPGAMLRDVLESLAVVHGVFDWVAPRDEAYYFFELGCYLERIDLASRLLNMRFDQGWPEQGPATMLRSVGGLSTYLRGHVRMSGQAVRRFLLTDTAFPRSVMRSSIGAETALREIGSLNATRVESVVQSVGLLRSQLEYTGHNANETMIESLISQSLKAVEATSAAVRDNFFRPVGSIVWSH
jgi:uncharacterized alpha-E superfamily protein